MKVSLQHQSTTKLPTQCLSLAEGPGGRLFAACLDGGIYALDREGGDPVELGRHDNFASGVNWSGAAGQVISSGYDGSLLWLDPDQRQLKRKLTIHQFWSWQSALSPDGRQVASSTGQYLCGGYKYEPAPEREPSVRVVDTTTGRLTHAFEHVPPVESVAFSHDGTHLAAGNLMGEVRIWNLESGTEVARIETPSFTGWGIIKGHYYTGGVFSLAFAPDDSALYLAGMGTTRDPAAGNGKQLWERWSWRDGSPKKEGSANDGEIGQGLMESLAFHPSGRFFAMGGRLFKGQWNVALFETADGSRLTQLDTKMRISKVLWSADGKHLHLAGGSGQPSKPAEIENPSWGRVKTYEVV